MQQESMVMSPQGRFATDLIRPPSYSSIFYHNKPSPTASGSPNTATATNSHSHSHSPPISTPQRSQAGSHSASAAAISSLSRLMTEHQELLKKHAMCLLQLEKTFKEAETLRQENTNLRMANADLSSQLSLMIQFYLQTHFYDKEMDKEMDKENEKEDMLFSPNKPDALFLPGSGEKRRESNGGWDDEFLKASSPEVRVKEDSPVLVQGQNGNCGSGGSGGGSGGGGGGEGGKVSLPKSISVRSSNYMKVNTGSPSGTGGSGGGGSGGVISGLGRRSTRVRSPKPADSAGPQKVYVRGGSKKDGPIELEVYNQGVQKTELCNKWEETGTCPYDDRCQFAHGIGELRPVIRHPRYKTEVCRMVLNGDPCPYGHRCHFRHALTEQEKNMVPLRMA